MEIIKMNYSTQFIKIYFVMTSYRQTKSVYEQNKPFHIKILSKRNNIWIQDTIHSGLSCLNISP